MSDYKEILTSDRVYKKYKSIILIQMYLLMTSYKNCHIFIKFQRILLKRVRKY